MKVSLSSVAQFVNLTGLSVDEIAQKLTFAGVEVEGIEEFAQGTNLVIGEVKRCENMENSDHLHVTEVYCGPLYGTLHIVCGAPNVREGIKVIVARDGAELIGGKIKNSTIRGHASEGMLCSLVELGVDKKFLSEEEIGGIAELDEDAPVGEEDVLGYLHLKHTILDLNILADRSDLFSVINVAKEIGTLCERHFENKILDLDDIKRVDDGFKVGSESEKCPQFAITVIKGIETHPSPLWLKYALNSAGIRSINNIVDIGNYVMLLTGQPLHMYDLDKLPKQELIVKDDYEGDFVALDEKTYELKKGDLVVTSDNKVMCLGGVMGSLECAVDEKTTNIAVEAANFYYSSIRRTSTRLNLVSDSSQRFVKGINPHQADFVLHLASVLIKSLANGKEFHRIHNYSKIDPNPTVVPFTIDRINGILGTNFSKEQIVSALNRDYIVTKEDGDKILATIPFHRIDIHEECDIAEEVIRIIGFDEVKSANIVGEIKGGFYHKDTLDKLIIRDYLRSKGLDEIVTYTLLSEKENASYNEVNKGEAIKILHPLTDEHEYIRVNLLSSLIKNANYNLSHQNLDFATFEVSDLYDLEKKYTHAAFVLIGEKHVRGSLVKVPYSFYDAKGLVNGILNLVGINPMRVRLERVDNIDETFHYGRSAKLFVDNKFAGIFGELHPLVKKELGISGKRNAVAAEIDLGYIFSLKTSSGKVKEVSKYPSISRDYAFVVDNSVTSDMIKREINKVDKTLINSVEVFDIYRGIGIKDGSYSIALTITYSSIESTLSDQMIAPIEKKMIETLENKLKATLRK